MGGRRIESLDGPKSSQGSGRCMGGTRRCHLCVARRAQLKEADRSARSRSVEARSEEARSVEVWSVEVWSVEAWREEAWREEASEVRWRWEASGVIRGRCGGVAASARAATACVVLWRRWWRRGGDATASPLL
jgi:hypothetical protein